VTKVSDYVAQFLADRGVKHIFMLAGGGCMHLVDSFGRQSGMEYVCCLHEQAVAFATQAYAEYLSGLGAALVTTGPGGTNTVTGLAAAWLDSTACIFISGQVKRADLLTGRGVRSMGPQEVDIVSVVTPLTKYAKTLIDPNDVRYELERAVHCATSGRRGPVWLDVPLDVQAAMVDETCLRGFAPNPELNRTGGITERAARAIELLKQAKRPVLFIGNGARQAHLAGMVEELVNALKVPVLLTWKTADMLPDDHAYFAGRPGSIASRGANFTQQNADWIMVLGARLDLPQVAFSHKNFARAAKKVLVDIDTHEIGKFDMTIDVPVHADVKDFLKELFLQLKGIVLPNTSEWLKKAKDWLTKYPVVLPEYWSNETGYVNTYVLIDALSEQCTPQDVLAPGSSGACSEIFLQSFRLKRGQRLINAQGLGAMGTGLPGAIGTCLASGRRRTICVNGDGGFQLNIQDLETVNRLKLPIKYFILSNGAYASIIAAQRTHFKGHLVGSDPSSHLTLPDVMKVAEAYGLKAMEIKDQREIRREVAAVLAYDGPVVCAVRVSSDQATLPRATTSARADGSLFSLPMEDLAPQLPRDEFCANMVIPPFDEQP
jgi:acetolactate synthase I/II/III large subunit